MPVTILLMALQVYQFLNKLGPLTITTLLDTEALNTAVNQGWVDILRFSTALLDDNASNVPTYLVKAINEVINLQASF